MDRSDSRLLLALAASVALHGWFALAELSGARRANIAAGAPLSVSLPAPAINYAAPEVEVPNVVTTPQQRQAADVAPVSAARNVARTHVATPDAESRSDIAIRGSATHTQPSDPTYYSARSLDVYPKALTALELGASLGSPKVRATVLIDESGSVNDVRAIEAANTEIEHAARELLLRTRFTPAAKDGRIVKAQVLVSLE